VCRNHIVWDAVDVATFSRKHTANVREALSSIRDIIGMLAEKRDERRDGFVSLVKKAIEQRLGSDSEETMKVLQQHGITRTLAKQALEIAAKQGRFTIFALVDALTRVSSQMRFAGDRVDVYGGCICCRVFERFAPIALPQVSLPSSLRIRSRIG
jgi:hypothetical protein